METKIRTISNAGKGSILIVTITNRKELKRIEYTQQIYIYQKKNSSIETTDKNNATIRDLPPKNIYDSRETVFFRDKKQHSRHLPQRE